MLAPTPPLGWNSWNTFGIQVNERLIYESAEMLVYSGLKDLGYVYLVIDDGWSLRHRDADRRLVPDPEKFPNGIRAVADSLHGMGLKLGIYSCAGCMTCGQFPGSYEHEFLDAQSFAEWGVDFLKYDYCFKPADESGALLYRRMGVALELSGRDILYSACSWGADDTKAWIQTTGAHTWRSTMDIYDTWESVKTIAHQQRELQTHNSAGCFNDMDMLVVGMHGKGNVGFQGCSFEQYRTHFSLWALLGSPLMIGCDIRQMDEETRRILMNREILAINQDRACRQPFIIGGFQTFKAGGDDDCFIWAKLLENGDFAIGMFNLADDSRPMYFCLAELGTNNSCGSKLIMKDLWNGTQLETIDSRFTALVDAHDCLMLRARVVEDM